MTGGWAAHPSTRGVASWLSLAYGMGWASSYHGLTGTYRSAAQAQASPTAARRQIVWRGGATSAADRYHLTTRTTGVAS